MFIGLTIDDYGASHAGTHRGDNVVVRQMDMYMQTIFVETWWDIQGSDSTISLARTSLGIPFFSVPVTGIIVGFHIVRINIIIDSGTSYSPYTTVNNLISVSFAFRVAEIKIQITTAATTNMRHQFNICC